MPNVIIISIFWIQCLLYVTSTAPAVPYPIGGMFTSVDGEVYSAFKHALREHNIVDRSAYFLLKNRTYFFNTSNGFLFSHNFCKILENGSFAVFGMADINSMSTLISYTNRLHMPFFSTSLADRANSSLYHMRMRPDYTNAMLQMIKKYKWSHFYYIYDTEEGLQRLRYFIEQLQKEKSKIQIESLRIKEPWNAYALLRHMDSRGQADEERVIDMNIVIDMSSQTAMNQILKQIQKVGMNRPNYHYLLGGLGFDELELDDFKHSGVNLTGFTIINHTSPFLKLFYKSWRKDVPDWTSAGPDAMISHQAALMHDAVRVFTSGVEAILRKNNKHFKDVFRRQTFYNNVSTGISCYPDAKTQVFLPWKYGKDLMDAFKKVNIDGLTGKIAFNEHGLRKDFKLNILEVSLNRGPSKIGTWDDENQTLKLDHFGRQNKFKHRNNETKIITTILSKPYLMLKKQTENGQPFHGNDRFEGYCADLAEAVAKIVKFKYILEPVKDNKYGTITEDGRWDGMIRELTEEPYRADLAIAPLTISSLRERVVDFSKPFMSLGISIMIKKPEKQKPGVFSFMDPLSRNIWMCIIFAYLGVSLVLFLVSRFSPYEWQVEDSINGPVFTNDFTILNSLWFALGAFMQQGCDISPRSISGRTVGSVWWFFTLIIISSYTANLAAFLTVERMLTPIESADDLSKQTEIQYGTLKSGSTMSFFQTSKIDVYERMWKYMNMLRDHVFVEQTEDGVEKVRSSKGKYAFLLESTMNEYYNQRKPCNTMKVGTNLDSKGYGIATPLNSPLRDDVSLAVLQLREEGELRRKKKKVPTAPLR